ncbi:glycoside hydrolase family 2 TIM barrel-domain containing protein [Paenibacillus sp. S28]|uniref:glycoside hydrolase family 2 TIM barrel-domain containing protein n=1 Tax=Paenibacillus sp. S28 TaxID=2767463 RepID=UPI001F1598CB|nr:glycoside hydrolase family 2 TIM barrel-domain containing protein [Paenibacillus sp. S28]
MLTTLNLAGIWELQLDGEKSGLQTPFTDTMELPGTTSHARKGERNEAAEIGSLTDEYRFEGYAWFSRTFEVDASLTGLPCLLYLERTRVTTVWIDGEELGSRNSLSTPHVYEISGGLTAGTHTMLIRVDNTNYPTKGGHLTSPDTQTNWNGITGRIELQFTGQRYLQNVQVYPDTASRSVTVKACRVGISADKLVVSASGFNGDYEHRPEAQSFSLSDDREVVITYPLGEDARLWSEFDPYLYKLNLRLEDEEGTLLDVTEIVFGLRAFQADGDKFTINGVRTFLRGKHDGLIFPLTAYAPTTVDEWLRVLTIAKSYGINHYRFHTCCPPEAAFTAADLLGIYMEPELPFWGTVTDESDPNHNAAEQEYLIQEGFSMLESFGNHPSFVMMSLGNELWGSKARLSEILAAYKAFDDRPLYTQGSNNFQFVPDILPEEDFFCGVRFSRDRLFRGSYAMCDAPQGHVQTDMPSTRKDYDEQIQPSVIGKGPEEGTGNSIQIQYGTGTKTVQASAVEEQLIPRIPVVSHEIGQYATFPNFGEIEKYTGPLKARNFETFRKRLEDKGLGHLAEAYFWNSGQLAVDCYKEELEAAFRSRRLAGFQLLDLQDFSGQGTALVGVLDAFMDSKGLVAPEEWRTFCSDAVLLARFDKYHFTAGERFDAHVELAYFRGIPLNAAEVVWNVAEGGTILAEGTLAAEVSKDDNYVDFGDISFVVPEPAGMTQVTLSLAITGTDIRKTYPLWLYPSGVTVDESAEQWVTALDPGVLARLAQGESLLLTPDPARLESAVDGTYCTDFWCYPMFRSISESMNKPVPVGTMGLLIDHLHPALRHFPSVSHSTYPWWSIATHSRPLILDELSQALSPIVQTIDNFERNHKLGLLFECRVGAGRLLVCPLNTEAVIGTPEGKQFLHSLIEYVRSEDFDPQVELAPSELQAIL